MRTPGRSSGLLAAMLAVVVVASSSVAFFATPLIARAETSGIDLSVLAGPGWEYDTLTVAPAGAEFSIDGEAVDGFSPATFNGVSGWIETGSVSLAQEVAPVAEAPVSEEPVGEEPEYQEEPVYEEAPVDEALYEEAPVYEAPVYEEPVYDEAATLTANGETTEVAPVESQPETVISADPVTSEEPVADAEAAPVEKRGRGDAPDDLAPPAGEPTGHADRGGDYAQREILDIIRQAAADHGQNPEAMIRVAKCESGLNPNAVGGGTYYGLFQFVPDTFARTPYGDGDIFDPTANAQAAGWMWEQGRKGEWSCQ